MKACRNVSTLKKDTLQSSQPPKNISQVAQACMWKLLEKGMVKGEPTTDGFRLHPWTDLG